MADRYIPLGRMNPWIKGEIADKVFVCTDCGALVYVQGIHDGFHKDLDKRGK